MSQTSKYQNGADEEAETSTDHLEKSTDHFRQHGFTYGPQFQEEQLGDFLDFRELVRRFGPKVNSTSGNPKIRYRLNASEDGADLTEHFGSGQEATSGDSEQLAQLRRHTDTIIHIVHAEARKRFRELGFEELRGEGQAEFRFELWSAGDLNFGHADAGLLNNDNEWHIDAGALKAGLTLLGDEGGRDAVRTHFLSRASGAVEAVLMANSVDQPFNVSQSAPVVVAQSKHVSRGNQLQMMLWAGENLLPGIHTAPLLHFTEDTVVPANYGQLQEYIQEHGDTNDDGEKFIMRCYLLCHFKLAVENKKSSKKLD